MKIGIVFLCIISISVCKNGGRNLDWKKFKNMKRFQDLNQLLSSMRQEEDTECKKLPKLVRDSVVITSPKYPASTPSTYPCFTTTLSFIAPEGKVLKMSCPVFDIADFNCMSAYLSVSDGRTHTERICGSDFEDFTSSGNNLLITYSSLLNYRISTATVLALGMRNFKFSCNITAISSDVNEPAPVEKASCQCGKLQGWSNYKVDTRTEDFPWHASVYLGDVYACSGAIISNRWLVTANDCLPAHANMSRVSVGIKSYYIEETVLKRVKNNGGGKQSRLQPLQDVKHPMEEEEFTDHKIIYDYLYEAFLDGNYGDIGIVENEQNDEDIQNDENVKNDGKKQNNIMVEPFDLLVNEYVKPEKQKHKVEESGKKNMRFTEKKTGESEEEETRTTDNEIKVIKKKKKVFTEQFSPVLEIHSSKIGNDENTMETEGRIGLLKLSYTVKFDESFRKPICLPYHFANKDFQYQTVKISGKVEEDIKRLPDLKVLPANKCDARNREGGSDLMCVDTGDVCLRKKNSLIWKNFLNDRYYLLGMATDDNMCSEGLNVSSFSSVLEYLQWITDMTGRTFCDPLVMSFDDK